MSSANVIDLEARRKSEGTVVADPDKGYTRIANQIMDQLFMLDISAGAFRVLHAVIRHTYGFQRSTDRFTNTYLQNLTGLGLTSIKDALTQLEERKVICVEKSGVFKVIGINKSISDWQLDGGKSERNSRAKKEQVAANPTTIESRESGHKKPRIRHEVAANPTTIGRESGHTKEESLQKKVFKESQQGDGVIQIFEHWKTVMKKSHSKLTPERKAKIQARLKDYPADFLMDAIDGCSMSDFHMGRQPGKPEQYTDIELIFRNGSKVEQFAEMKKTHQPAQADDWTQGAFVGQGGLV